MTDDGRAEPVIAPAPRRGIRRARAEPERGSATIYVVAELVLLAMAAAAVLGVIGIAVARHRAETAADLGALAGADVLGQWLRTGAASASTATAQAASAACARAAEVVVANGAALMSCERRGSTLQVMVRRPLPWAARWSLPPAQVSSAAEALPDAARLVDSPAIPAPP